MLVGLAVLGLPQTIQKCLGFRDAKSMNNGMIIGTFVVGFLLLAMHLVGALGRAVVPGIEVGDLAVPTITVRLLSPFWAGVFIAGPLAAIMSTVDSMLIISSAAIVKDLYHHYASKRGIVVSPRKLFTMIFMATAVVGTIVFIAALRPPSLLVWINLFASGGWRRYFSGQRFRALLEAGHAAGGPCWSMAAGSGAFFWMMMHKIQIGGTHQIVPSIAIALAAFIAGSYLGKKPDEETIRAFWG